MLRSPRSKAAREREMRKRQPPRPGRGRPQLPIHPENVRFLASRGFTLEHIAAVLHCSPSTIRGRFGEDYEQGYHELNVQLRFLMFQLALSGDPLALKWELRQRGLYQPPRKQRVSRATAKAYGAPPKQPRKPRQKRAPAAKKPPFATNNVAQATQQPALKPNIVPSTPAPPRAPWTIVEFAL